MPDKDFQIFNVIYTGTLYMRKMMYVIFPTRISMSTDQLLNVVALAPEPGQAIFLTLFVPQDQYKYCSSICT
jgi:hypothetical protein